MEKYILSIDQGTTSTRAIVFDRHSHIISMASEEITQIYPQPGWVEQDANEIWLTVTQTINEALVKRDIDRGQIEAIGITNQRETTVIWDRETGDPIYNAIVWQSRQTTSICEELITKGYNEVFKNKTGLLIDPYFSGTKIKWILDNVDGAREKAEAGQLAFGTIDSWIIYKLTGTEHKTDYSNASRTLIYNIHELKWDDELLSILDIPKSMLPEVCNSSGFFGHTRMRNFFGKKIPITGVAGDQQASLFGQHCINPGMVNSTYGTGCFVLMNTGDKLVQSENGMLSTIAWKIDNKICYAIEGSVFVGGSTVQWLRDGLKIIKDASETEDMAKSISSNDGVYFVPAFVGLGTPYWDPKAKGAIFGLTRGTDEKVIARAALEAICYQVQDVLYAMEADSEVKIPKVKANGGATINNFLMQFQSDIMGLKVLRPSIMDMTALGAAYLAGLFINYWENHEDIMKYKKPDTVFQPKMSETKRNELIRGWNIAVKSTRNFKL